jgi:ABC-2 type transport system ATP-binding protein
LDDVIAVNGLTRSFGGLRAVDGLSFSVAEGEVFGMLGPNGAGKTTTVRLLNGILHPDEGHAMVLGHDPRGDGAAVRSNTGVLTETPSVYERLSARDNLRFYGTLYGLPEADLDRRADQTLEALGLAERARDRAGTFSRGMKQRLALARAIMHDPPLLFLDEPTAALDPEAAKGVLDLIEHLSREARRTVIICTHNLNEAQRLCDRVAIMKRGRALAVGRPSELAREIWPDAWLDFTLREPDEAIPGRLTGNPAVLEASLEGDRLSVRLPGEDAVPTVVASVVAAGGRIMRVVPRERTLEDVYFELQGRDGHAEVRA